MANLFKDTEVQNVEYKSKIYDSMKLALVFATIATCGLILIGEDSAIVLFGLEFEKSGGIICLLSLTVIASAWSNVIRTQFLIPTNRDKIYVISTIIGASLNLVLNFVFIPLYGAYGACIGTIVTEFAVMIYQSICVRKKLECKKYFKILLINFSKALIMISCAYLVAFWIDNIVLRLLTKIMITIGLFFLFNYKYVFYDFLGRRKIK